MLTFISNTDHFKEVLSRVQAVKHTLWIGIADIKDLYVDVRIGKHCKHCKACKRRAFCPDPIA